MLKYKVEYDPLSVNEYQKQSEEQQIKYMKKRAAKLGYQLCLPRLEKGQLKVKGVPGWRTPCFGLRLRSNLAAFCVDSMTCDWIRPFLYIPTQCS